jgi:hypothetical protein
MNKDIIYKIGLYFNLKKSIALIGSCKILWDKRVQFYIEKQLLWHPGKKVIDIWTPEQNYYLSDKQLLLLGATNYTLHNELSDIHIYNNITYKLINGDNKYVFRPNFVYILIYDCGQMEINYFHTLNDVMEYIETLKKYIFVQYTIVELK